MKLTFAHKMVLALALIGLNSGCQKNGFGLGSTNNSSEESNLGGDLNNNDYLNNQGSKANFSKPATEKEALSSIDKVQTQNIKSLIATFRGDITSLSGRQFAENEQTPPADSGAGSDAAYGGATGSSTASGGFHMGGVSSNIAENEQTPPADRGAGGGGWGAAQENTTVSSAQILARIKAGACDSAPSTLKKGAKADALAGIAELEEINQSNLRASVQVLIDSNLAILKALVQKL